MNSTDPNTLTHEIEVELEELSAAARGLRDVRALSVLLLGFCVFLNVYATQAILPLLTGVFNATKFRVSLTLSATTIGIALAAPVFGLVGERFGRRQTMVASLALVTIPILLCATAPTLSILIGWRFVEGLLMPGILAVALAYISEEWSGGGAAATMALYVAGNVLGGIAGRFLCGFIADHWSWRISFIVLGTLNALGTAAVWRWLPHSQFHRHGAGLREAVAGMAAQFRRPVLLATFAVGMAMLFSLVAAFTYITFYLAAPPFGLGTTALGSLFIVYIAGVFITPVCGRWIERIGHRPALAIAALVSALGVALTLIHSLVAVMAGLAICSSGIFVCQATAASYLGHVAGKGRSYAAGLYTTFYYSGATLGAAVPAYAWKLGEWPACVALIVAVLVIDAALALIFWKGAEADEVELPALAGG